MILPLWYVVMGVSCLQVFCVASESEDRFIFQRSLARHYSDKYSLHEAVDIQLELLAANVSADDKISVYSDMVENMALLGSYSVQHWCKLAKDMESILQQSDESFPWENMDWRLPETVPRGNALYYALYTAEEECGDYVAAWRCLMKALDMERKSRHMKMILSTNQYHFEDKIGNYIPVFNYLSALGIRGGPGIVYPIIVMGSSRAAASLAAKILGGHDAIFSLPQEHARLDYILKRRVDHETARGVFMSKVVELMGQIIDISREGIGVSDAQQKKVGQLVSQAIETYLRFNFGIAQLIREEGKTGMATMHYVEYIGDNAQVLGILRLLFPDAIVLNVVDDPLNAFLDIITERTDQSMESQFYALHPLHAAKSVAIQANTVEFFRKQFQTANPEVEGISDILYRDLVFDPENTLSEAVLARLGLSWQDKMTSEEGAGFLLRRAERRKDVARNYMKNGDITMYQSIIHQYSAMIILEEGWTKPTFPFPDEILWNLGPQATLGDDGCAPALGDRLPTRRDDIGRFLDSLGFTVGAELGVQQALFSNITLSGWTNCKKYYLIDIWDQQNENYFDSANIDKKWQDRFYLESQKRLEQYKHRTELIFLRKFTSEAVADIEDNSLDYVYVDARHDYCSVWEDILLYWGKLKEGGILAGHDYMLGSALKEMVEGEFTDRFDICPNGTIRERSVKGAVDDFVSAMGLQAAFTFQDQPPFLSFLIRKPCRSHIFQSREEL